MQRTPQPEPRREGTIVSYIIVWWTYTPIRGLNVSTIYSGTDRSAALSIRLVIDQTCHGVVLPVDGVPPNVDLCVLSIVRNAVTWVTICPTQKFPLLFHPVQDSRYQHRATRVNEIRYKNSARLPPRPPLSHRLYFFHRRDFDDSRDRLRIGRTHAAPPRQCRDAGVEHTPKTLSSPSQKDQRPLTAPPRCSQYRQKVVPLLLPLHVDRLLAVRLSRSSAF